jgi:hypothetical protein
LGELTLVELCKESGAFYVFSLTEGGDALSQWRGYCKDGAGYAIGFKFEKLRDWCAENHFRLSNVIYGTDEYSKGLIRLAVTYISELTSYFPFFEEGGINSDIMENFASRYARKILEAAPFIKHHGFSEEREWRIVQLSPHGKQGPEVHYRDGEFSLIPYVIWKFSPVKFFESIGVINIKTSEYAELASEALKEFVRSEGRKHGLDEAPISEAEISEIPYRPGF